MVQLLRKMRECSCGCGKTFSVTEYPCRKFAPDCESKNKPSAVKMERERIEQIGRASELPGYNPHHPEKFIRMLNNEK